LQQRNPIGVSLNTSFGAARAPKRRVIAATGSIVQSERAALRMVRISKGTANCGQIYVGFRSPQGRTESPSISVEDIDITPLF
jgi:hypothetical protein